MSIKTCGCDHPEWGKPCSSVETYKGAVLSLRERNGYDDSDFLAMVWDEETKRTRVVEYASTRSWTYHNGAEIDATPEVEQAALSWYREAFYAAEVSYQERLAIVPTVGKRIRSLTTRGKNVGVTGTVKKIIDTNYGFKPGKAVGVEAENENGLRWIDIDRVEVLDPTPVDTDEVRKYVDQLGIPTSWFAGLDRLIYRAMNC